VPDIWIDSTATGGANDGSSWADAYLDLNTALTDATDPIAENDVVWFASVHDEQNAVDINFILPNGTVYISVDKTDDSYAPGAKIVGTGTNNSIYFKGTVDGVVVKFKGIFKTLGDNSGVTNASSNYTFEDGEITMTSVTYQDVFSVSVDGIVLTLKNYTFSLGAKPALKVSNGSFLTLDDATIETTTRTGSPILMQGNGGSSLLVKNSDLTAIVLDAYPFIGVLGVTSDICKIELSRCLLPASFTLLDTTTSLVNLYADLYSCDTGSGYHYFESYRYEGKVYENTTVKRTGGANYDGTNGFTASVTPNSNVIEFVNPLLYRLKTPTLDLSGGTTTLTVHILLQDSAGTPVSLTTKNCRIKVVYPDATDTVLGKTVYSNPTEDILSIGSALDIEGTPTFTGTSGTTKQHYLSVDIPQNTATGMDEAVCELWLEVSKDLSTGTTEMFVCPEPTVS